MEYVTVAKILKPFGLKGECRCFCLTSHPKQRFKKGTAFLLSKGSNKKEVVLASSRINGDQLYLRFEGLDTIEAIEAYKGYEVDMKKEDATLEKDEYRYSDLVGCLIVDKQGNALGKVKEVFSYSPTWTLRVAREEGKDFFVPFVDAFVKEIDIEGKKITIVVVEGML